LECWIHFVFLLGDVVEKSPSGGTATLNRVGRGRNYRTHGTRVSGLEAAQNFVGGVLQPCIRLVQLTSCFAGQLTELVAIGHMRECPKNQIRTHCHILLHQLPARLATLNVAGAARESRMNQGLPQISTFKPLDAQHSRLVQKS
jgi:hypothetical protein